MALFVELHSRSLFVFVNKVGFLGLGASCRELPQATRSLRKKNDAPLSRQGIHCTVRGGWGVWEVFRGGVRQNCRSVVKGCQDSHTRVQRGDTRLIILLNQVPFSCMVTRFLLSGRTYELVALFFVGMQGGSGRDSESSAAQQDGFDVCLVCC